MHRISLSLLLTACLWPMPALSQSRCSIPAGQSCACAVPLDALQSGVFGELDPAGGEVLVTQANGSASMTAPQSLSVGDSVVVLGGGSAFLRAGSSCRLALPAQSSLTIRAVNGCACASLVEAEEIALTGGQDLHVPGHLEDTGTGASTGGAAGTGTGGAASLIATGVFVGSMTAAIFAIEAQQEDESVSP